MAAPFCAIIIGGGLIGVTAAHIFSKTNMEFIILEKHDTPLSTFGSTLALWPQTLRISDQLGLLDAVQPILDHLHKCFVLSSKDAKIFDNDRTLEYVEKNHGYGIRITHRPEMLKFLFANLTDSAKSKILLKRKATSIAVSEKGVTVLCDDGTSQEETIVIGADGVRSQTRLLLRAIKTGKEPDDLSDFQKSPYVLTYRTYFGSCPILPGLATNTRYDAAGDRVSTQIINGTDRAWFGIYEQLDPPSRQRISRYTEADKQAIVDRTKSLYMAPGWTVRDVDSQRIGETSLIDLEEGWKFEPHAGLGYNAGVTDLVVLVNGLRRLLQANGSPSTQDFDELFQGYQAERAKDTQEMERLSMKTVRLLAWPTWRYKILATYVLPYLPLRKINFTYAVGPVIGGSPVLEWLAERTLPASVIPRRRHPSKPISHFTT
ncbi:putative monooxygenase [Nemania sp. NC0429]|nr:putative monooxygenase [Nemania sp. NC0429]